MTEKIITTPAGPIRLVINQKYTLKGLVGMNAKQLQPFLDLFRVNCLSGLVRVLIQNNLMIHDGLLNDPHLNVWLDKPLNEIKTLMETKGIWLPGMIKYFAIKVLLMSHQIVQDNPSEPPKPPSDLRKSITVGPHYEALPDRDFSINTKRDQIRRTLIQNDIKPMLTGFDSKVLSTMFKLYDTLCFNNELSGMIKEKERKLDFKTNLTSKSKGGLHSYDPSSKTHTLKVSPFIIGNLFSNGETNLKSNGMVIKDRLEGLMNVFEHEITHLYCSLKGYTRKIKEGPGKMYYSPHGKLFQELVFRFFGHTEYRHSFNHGEATDQLIKTECRVGMTVYFDSEKLGKTYGKILRVNIKRCVINTEKDGQMHVPFSMLRLSDREVTVPDVKDFKSQFRVGDGVKFDHKYKPITGTIKKCNPTRAKVNSNGGIYDVPYQMLTKI